MNSDAIVETVLGFYPDLEAIYLFGTYQTEGEWPDSDVDIALLFSHNRAIGNGGNPAQSGTPGGGSGGAIYNDGNTMTLALYGTLIENNQVNTHGSAIFFITNDHTGTLRIEDSVIRQNSGGYWYELPGISMHSDTNRQIVNSTIE